VASDSIVIRGAREHNLKNVSLELPRDQLIVFTGLSGSGKSSLAFDTIYAEGQRRYVESLSAYARQFLGQMEKPDVDFIEGLSPAISIDQKTASRNPRSTVGTVTEIHDYLRLLYLELANGTRFQVLAPVVRGRKGEYESLLKELSREGFSRARIDGEVRDLAEDIRLDRYYQHTIEVIVDRLVRKDGIERRLTDSLETALRLAEGVALIDVEGGAALTFSQHFACDHCGISFEELQPRNFSFNSPYGACTSCNGIGTRYQVDWRLAIPNPDKSINEGAIIPWMGRHRATYYSRLLEGVAAKHGLDLDRPFSKMVKKQKAMVLQGTGDQPITVTYTNRFGRERRYQTTYEGLVPWLIRRHENADGDGAREFYQQYMRLVPCESCEGARLNPVSLAVKIGGLNINEVSSQSLRKASAFLDDVELDSRQSKIAAAVLKEIQARLNFLLDVGLDYLTLSRSAATLAGGEAQRIRLATQIGSGLVGVLYILDEPSIGLHQRDNQRLIETLIRLRDLGNTVIVVEHDEETIRTADYVVDIGPGAGEHGGRIVAEGTLETVIAEESSLTGDYLAGRRNIPLPLHRREADGRSIIIRGAAENNLKDLDVEIPMGLFVAVTGVSGSGKSTLVEEILSKSLAFQLYGSRALPGLHKDIEGLDLIDKAINIDQSPIGRTPRSNAATYTKVFDKMTLRGVQGRRANQDRDALPARRLHPLRAVQGQALQPRDAGDPLEGPHDRRRARHVGLRGHRVLREPTSDPAGSADAGGRGSRLHQARPASPDPVGRRGPAREACQRTRQASHRSHLLHPRRAHHWSPLRGRPQAAGCSATPRRRREHHRGDRAQPGCREVGRLDHRPGPRRR